MSTLAVSPEYTALLKKFPPKVIRTEEENGRYSRKLSAAEKELAELLTLLIEDFEEKHYRLPRSSPLAVLQFLIEQHSLKQKDLVDVFGSPSIVSEVLSGKRSLNKDHIERLSARFHVSPELFF
jgi:HTH-type transcriptional regulator/antitoxin HigA